MRVCVCSEEVPPEPGCEGRERGREWASRLTVRSGNRKCKDPKAEVADELEVQ